MHQLQINVHLNYSALKPMDILIQLQAAQGYGQNILAESLEFNTPIEQTTICGNERIGERIWLNTTGNLILDYATKVEVTRKQTQLSALTATPINSLDETTTNYLMPSCYCPTFDFSSFVEGEFQGLSGGQLVLAMVEWIKNNLEYVIGSSNTNTTALETFTKRQGVCRDYAHVLISMCRAAVIPARYVSAYSCDVSPQDIHAVVEVYLGGEWHIIDATDMSSADRLAIIGVGADAADVSFLTSFGFLKFVNQRVEVKLV